MNTYHKIQSIYKRDMENNGKIVEGVYSLPEFEYLKDNIWVFTEKVDGTNIRVMWDGVNLKFGGKTDKASIPADLVSVLYEMFLKDLFIEKFGIEPIEVCLYGEGYGGKIQAGGKYRKDVSFVLFDIKIGHWWLRREDVEKIAKDFNLETVPVIGYGTLDEAVEMVKEGFNSTWGDFEGEGIVARPEIELKGRSGERIITKIKCSDFNS